MRAARSVRGLRPRAGAARGRGSAALTGVVRLVRRGRSALRPSVRRVLHALRGLRARWRMSLRVRVIAITVGFGALAIVALGWYLTSEIRTGMFDERVEQMLSDAAERTATAQESIDYATATTGAEIQQLANYLVGSLQGAGSGAVGTLLLRSPSDLGQVVIIDPVTDRALIGIITPELREAVRREGGQQWQSVAVPEGATTGPGIAVGSPVTLKSAGPYELYFVYSLAREDETLLFVQRTLAVGAVALLLLVAAMAWYLTRKVLQPVRQAAITAERLSDGRLGERIPVHGHDELATLGRSFNEMAESLQDQIRRMEELSRMQQRFVSDVSHELRTPLTTIRMAGDVIHAARREFRPAVARSAELLANQLDRFDVLLADLLEISRFDAGAALLDAEEWDVRTLVGGVVEATAPLAEDRGVPVIVRVPPEPCTADLDRRRIERIVRNLLVNAVEHAEGAPVEVEVGMDERAVAVVVRDHGVGMTAQEAAHVFDRFWRADPARARTTGGTGLGLAISLEDARLHGGRLEAWGRPGEGASFRLTLPRRAGVALEGSPLELVVSTGAPPVPPRAPQADGPAAVPQLDDLGLR
jgi:two-component system sensor histidine kinase MtrB